MSHKFIVSFLRPVKGPYETANRNKFSIIELKEGYLSI